MRGKFIVIDGGDGTGKSAVLKHLRAVFPDAVHTREPGGSPFAEKIRALILDPDAKDADPKALVALFTAARIDHIQKVIKPKLEEGRHVFCGRFVPSTYAYQVRGGSRRDLASEVHSQREWLLDLRTWPDHYIILDGDPRICLPRTKKRAAEGVEELNHFDEQTFEFHDRVRQGFKDFVRPYSHTIINAEEAEEVVRAKVLAVVQKVIAER